MRLLPGYSLMVLCPVTASLKGEPVHSYVNRSIDMDKLLTDDQARELCQRVLGNAVSSTIQTSASLSWRAIPELQLAQRHGNQRISPALFLLLGVGPRCPEFHPCGTGVLELGLNGRGPGIGSRR